MTAGIPVTGHVSIGSDIIHSLPSCDGAALGQTSYTDFLIVAESLQKLEGGVFLNHGSAVTGPEVFLKALSMVRNLARQRQETVTRFTTAVFDLVPLPEDFRQEFPDATHAGYYFRPWKSLRWCGRWAEFLFRRRPPADDPHALARVDRRGTAGPLKPGEGDLAPGPGRVAVDQLAQALRGWLRSGPRDTGFKGSPM